MLELIKLRSQIVSGNLPVDEMKDIKMKATSEIDTGNKLLGKVISRWLRGWRERE
jgi:dedicator of cytokinesis protein 1